MIQNLVSRVLVAARPEVNYRDSVIITQENGGVRRTNAVSPYLQPPHDAKQV